MYPGYELHFEMVMRSILGEKAEHISMQATSVADRRRWFVKALKKLVSLVDSRDTSTPHKESLLVSATGALDAIEKKKNEQLLLMNLLQLCARLMGFYGVRGSVLYTPVYSQNDSQRLTEVIFRERDDSRFYSAKRNSVATRRRLVDQLLTEGFPRLAVPVLAGHRIPACPSWGREEMEPG